MISGKVTRVSKSGGMLQVDIGADKPKWYFLSDPVKTFVGKIKIGVGSDVTIDVKKEDGNDTQER